MRSNSRLRWFLLYVVGLALSTAVCWAWLGDRTDITGMRAVAVAWANVIVGSLVGVGLEVAISEWLFRRELRAMVAVMQRPEWRRAPDWSHPAVARWFGPRSGSLR